MKCWILLAIIYKWILKMTSLSKLYNFLVISKKKKKSPLLRICLRFFDFRHEKVLLLILPPNHTQPTLKTLAGHRFPTPDVRQRGPSS